MKCFFHKDLDGVCSAAIVKHKHRDCELIGIDYGESFPWGSIGEDETIYMVDFALQPFEQMLKLKTICNLIWIDHHSSAIAEYTKSEVFLKGLVTEGRAGCELTWQYLFPNEKEPHAVKYLGRYDVWDVSDPKYIQFQYGMRSAEDVMNPEALIWSLLKHEGLSTNHGGILNSVSSLLEKGKAILSYITNDFKTYALKHSHEVQFEGMTCIAVNRGCASSTLFDSVYDKDKHKIMIPYCKLPDGRWTISLYTTHDDVDCGAIAKKYGGGGHRQAAGLQSKELPF